MRGHEQTKTKKMKSALRRRRLFIMLPMCILIVWGFVKIVDNMVVASEKKVAIAELEERLKEQQRLKKYYKQEINNLKDREYREQKARKQLQMAKPGDTMFSLPE